MRRATAHLKNVTKLLRLLYKTKALIKINKINILKVPIETIYYSKGESKFNKFKDSIIIYKVLFSYKNLL